MFCSSSFLPFFGVFSVQRFDVSFLLLFPFVYFPLVSLPSVAERNVTTALDSCVSMQLRQHFVEDHLHRSHDLFCICT